MRPDLQCAHVAQKLEKGGAVFGKGIVCDTDTRGHATPDGKSVLELVVTVSEGFIPLWTKGTTLRWRFQEHSLQNDWTNEYMKLSEKFDSIYIKMKNYG